MGKKSKPSKKSPPRDFVKEWEESLLESSSPPSYVPGSALSVANASSLAPGFLLAEIASSSEPGDFPLNFTEAPRPKKTKKTAAVAAAAGGGGGGDDSWMDAEEDKGSKQGGKKQSGKAKKEKEKEKEKEVADDVVSEPINFEISYAASPRDLSSSFRCQIWSLFLANMEAMYKASSFHAGGGSKRDNFGDKEKTEKVEELFDVAASRYLLVTAKLGKGGGGREGEAEVAAFVHFRLCEDQDVDEEG